MKILSKTIVGVLLATSCSLAQAEWSSNIGYASEYYFRGIPQKTSSASGGLDYESGGFYAGTWAADVGDGLEVDGYFGYGAEVGEVALSIGYTGYFYTGDFDTEYHEINLGAGFGLLSLGVDVGQHEVESGSDEDFIHYSLTIEKDGLYGTFGGFSQDFEGEYLELGYGTSVAEIDLGIALIICDEIESEVGGILNADDEVVVFTLGKSFDL